MDRGFRPAPMPEELIEDFDEEAEHVLGVDPEGISFRKKLEAVVKSHRKKRRAR